MKIIETPDQTWSDTFECSRCNTKFEADQDDLEYGGWKVSGYWFNDTAVVEERFSVDCPMCNTASFVDRDAIPVLLRDKFTRK